MPPGVPESQELAIQISRSLACGTRRAECDSGRRDNRAGKKGRQPVQRPPNGKRARHGCVLCVRLSLAEWQRLPANAPLVERKALLSEFVRASRCPRLLYAQHIDGAGKQFFAEICAHDLEGIVAKRKLGIYKDDAPGWLKLKNPTYSQAEGRHELLTRGR